MTLRLGWKAGTEQYPPRELLDYALAAEQAGFDSIDASDHFHPWSEQGKACFAWSWLGAAAAQTAGPDQRAFIEGYGRDVLPQLRKL